MGTFLHLVSKIKWLMLVPALLYLTKGLKAGGIDDATGERYFGAALLYAGFMAGLHGLSDRDREPMLDIPDGLGVFLVGLSIIVAFLIGGVAVFAVVTGQKPANHEIVVGMIGFSIGLMAGSRAEIDANRY